MNDLDLDKIIKTELDKVDFAIKKRQKHHIKKAIYEVIKQYEDVFAKRLNFDKKTSSILKEIYFDIKFNHPEFGKIIDKKLDDELIELKKHRPKL